MPGIFALTLSLPGGFSLDAGLRQRSRALLTTAVPKATWLGSFDDLAALSATDGSRIDGVLLHDPRHPFLAVRQVAALIDAAPSRVGPDGPDGSAALVGVVEVTDTLKRVGRSGVAGGAVEGAAGGLRRVLASPQPPTVLGTVDRTRHRAQVGLVFVPGARVDMLVRAGALLVADVGVGLDPVLSLVQRLGRARLVDLTAGPGAPGAAAASRVDPQDAASVAYAEAVWASNAEATATSSG